jgi:hypothetical protein
MKTNASKLIRSGAMAVLAAANVVMTAPAAAGETVQGDKEQQQRASQGASQQAAQPAPRSPVATPKTRDFKPDACPNGAVRDERGQCDINSAND